MNFQAQTTHPWRRLLALLALLALAAPTRAQVDPQAARAWQAGHAPRDTQVKTSSMSPIDQSRALPITGRLRGNLAGTRAGEPAPAEVRGRFDTTAEIVEINWGLFDSLDPEGRDYRIGFPLPEGGELEVALLACEWRGFDRYTWVGQIAGVANSDVILVRHDDALRVIARNHNAHGRIFEIQRSSAGHVLTEFGGVNVPSCEGCVSGTPPVLDAPPEGRGTAQSFLGGPSDPDHVVDVMIVASELARFIDYGSSASAFAADAYLMVTDANLRLSNSASPLQLRMVAAPWDLIAGFAESGSLGIDLEELSLLQGQSYIAGGGTTVDSISDAIQNNRDLYRPDLVCLITHFGTGIGWAPGNVASVEERLGYFCSSQDLAVANGTFAHEAGHNLGACHNINASAPDCDQGINGTDRGIERLCDVPDGVCGGCEDTEYRTTMAYQVTTNPLNGAVRIQAYSVEGLQATLNGSFGSCTVDLWASNAKVRDTFEVTRPITSDFRIASSQIWAAPGSGGSAGTYWSPTGTVSSAVSLVNGGAAFGVVRANSGTYEEVGGTAVIYSKACRILAENGTVLIK